MRRIYSSLFYSLVPFLILRLFWKSRRFPAYRQRIWERFSLQRIKTEPVDIWVHAVSLGEVIATIPLIERLLQKSYRVCVTTMTPTGSQRVKAHFADRVLHHYIPYDLPWALRRFFNRIRPGIGIIMETELWPNLIYYAKKANIYLLLANARLSDNAFLQYKKAKCLFKPMLKQFDRILAQSEENKQRFITLGAREASVYALGNLKFDLTVPSAENNDIVLMRKKWGVDRTVIIAASTHDNEEALILSQFPLLQAAIPNVLLLIAPRHPERFEAVYQRVKSLGHRVSRRQDMASIDFESDVILIDSIGELLHCYRQSDYAFIGGSLVNLGGHNVLEPIAFGIPVICGPHMQNFKAIICDLQEAEAICIVQHAEELRSKLIELYKNKESRERQVKNALTVLAANQGCLEKYVQLCAEFLEKKGSGRPT